VARFLTSIGLKNILSFKNAHLVLEDLNVLIGPNAAGKTNLIDVIGLLHAAPLDLYAAIRAGGGGPAWIRKDGSPPGGMAAVKCEFSTDSARLEYGLEFSAADYALVIEHERLQQTSTARARGKSSAGADVYFERSGAKVDFREQANNGGQSSGGVPVAGTASVFSVVKSPHDKTPITRLGTKLERIQIYRGFDTGRDAPARNGTPAGTPKEKLEDGGGNLAVVLNEMDFDGSIERVNTYVRRLADQFEDVRVRLDGGMAQVYLKEKNLKQPISAIRLSDGTLKFLCLMVVLLHAAPPPLICIEEPEVGLHPDALQLVAEAIREATDHTQLIVTTHSDALIDALSGKPEAVVVCERDLDNTTSFKRLKRADLTLWLEQYRLGELWRKGEIGGNRW
jgi:predicted ATPase